MPKSPEIHHSFWKSTYHLYGCYGGIFMCMLVVFGFSNLSWYTASFGGYILGRIFYWIQGHFAKESTQSVPIENKTILIKQNIEPIITIDPQHSVRVARPLTAFDQFVILKHQIQPLLTSEANEKIQEIHSLLTLLNHKLKSSKSVETQRAIENIQCIINNYLTPTLTHYQELPIIFHNRPLDDGNTPDQLIMQQMNLVQDELLKMTEDIFLDDLNALLAHGLFLEQKLKPTQFFKVGSDLAPIRSHSDPKILN